MNKQSKNKIIVAMQPYFFPYEGYFQLLASADEIVLLDDVQFTRKGWINRNRIARDQELQISIPVSANSRSALISEMEISPSFFPGQLIKQLEHTYSKSENFEEIISLLKVVINNDDVRLCSWLRNSLEVINTYLGISTKILYSSEIDPSPSARGSQRIINLCEKRNATTYVNLSGGRNLYSHEEFSNRNIELKFIESNLSKYPRKNQSFIPALSIIDLMMYINCIDLRSRIQNDFSINS